MLNTWDLANTDLHLCARGGSAKVVMKWDVGNLPHFTSVWTEPHSVTLAPLEYISVDDKVDKICVTGTSFFLFLWNVK